MVEALRLTILYILFVSELLRSHITMLMIKECQLHVESVHCVWVQHQPRDHFCPSCHVSSFKTIETQASFPFLILD